MNVNYVLDLEQHRLIFFNPSVDECDIASYETRGI